MVTCTSCGHDVTDKKFCPECGTPVQAAVAPTVEAASSTCPRCNGAVKPGASFCMHCGASLTGQTSVATAQSQAAQPLTRQCIACHAEVPATTAFCTNCGQPMQAIATEPAPASIVYCNNCGRQNAAGVRFCGGCGSPLATGTPVPASQTYPQTGPYGQPSQTYASQYDPSQYGGQSQYGQGQYQQPGTAYPQQPQMYPQQGQPYPQQYGQMGYQQQPMMGQQPMVLRCPVCMAMAPAGTPNCASCRTSLAGVVPTPATMPVQGQQGGLGGMFQGQGGNMAMGALGGAAAVIGGEMLLHGLEREHERRYDDNGGLLGDLGGLANDVGLF